MKYKPKKRRGIKLNRDQIKLFRILVLPLIVIILIIIILIADRRKETQAVAEAEAESETELPTETLAPWENEERLPEEPGDEPDETESSEPETETETVYQEEFETEDFLRDSVPEILDLMKTYLNARATADAQAMNQVYGIGEVSSWELEERRGRMLNYSKYVQEFENVATYVKEGPGENCWLVYTVADINFYSAKTRAPMSLWCYVTRNGDGSYVIVDNSQFTQQQLRFVEEANHSAEVRKLAASVSARLLEALQSDENLKAVYGVLHADSPVWEKINETQPEISIVGSSQSESQSVTIEDTAGTEEGSAGDDGEIRGGETVPDGGEAGSGTVTESSAEGGTG